MCAWMRHCAGELVKPLVELMTERVRSSQVIHTDDTTVPIQSPGAKQCRKGRIWCYLGDEANPYTVYDYTPSRSRDGPAKWLSSYEGYLASRRLRRLRRHLSFAERDGSRLLGACAAEVLRCARLRRRSVPRRCLRSSPSCTPSSAKRKMPTTQPRLALRQARSVPVLERGSRQWLDAEQEVVLAPQPNGDGDHLRPEPVDRADTPT